MTDLPLPDRLRALLLEARRDRDRPRAALLRSLIAELENAEAVSPPSGAPETSSTHVAGASLGVGAAEAPRRELDEADQLALVVSGLAEVEAALPHLERTDTTRAAEERAALDGVRTALGLGGP